MAKRIVVTARGVKLDFDALKRSQPNTKPVVAGKKKDVSSKPVMQKLAVRPTSRRINATIPSPIPKPSDAKPVQVEPVWKVTTEVSNPKTLNNQKIVGQKVVQEEETFVDEPTIIHGSKKGKE
jgi:hypothetical protein